MTRYRVTVEDDYGAWLPLAFVIEAEAPRVAEAKAQYLFWKAREITMDRSHVLTCEPVADDTPLGEAD